MVFKMAMLTPKLDIQEHFFPKLVVWEFCFTGFTLLQLAYNCLCDITVYLRMF